MTVTRSALAKGFICEGAALKTVTWTAATPAAAKLSAANASHHEKIVQGTSDM